MHAAQIDKSKRLQRTLQILRSAGKFGVTSLGVQSFTGSMAPATDISEIRRNGYDIECKYVGMTDKGRKIYNFRLVGKREKQA